MQLDQVKQTIGVESWTDPPEIQIMINNIELTEGRINVLRQQIRAAEANANILLKCIAELTESYVGEHIETNFVAFDITEIEPLITRVVSTVNNCNFVYKKLRQKGVVLAYLRDSLKRVEQRGNEEKKLKVELKIQKKENSVANYTASFSRAYASFIEAKKALVPALTNQVISATLQILERDDLLEGNIFTDMEPSGTYESL